MKKSFGAEENRNNTPSETENRNWALWCAHVLARVRFTPDHKAIEKELTAHYQDHCRDLERIGYEQSLAEERALTAMGDAGEVGLALDRAHKPWLGWLWEASRVLAAGLLLLLAVTLLGNSRYVLGEMIERTADQFTYQAPPASADCVVTEYATLYLAPGAVTERPEGGYEAKVDLWVETEDFRTDFLPWIQRYLSAVDDRGPIPLGGADENGVWPDNYLSRGYSRWTYGWTRHQVTLSLMLDHRPEWVEITYPYGGNDWVLRAEWEAAE